MATSSCYSMHITPSHGLCNMTGVSLLDVSGIVIVLKKPPWIQLGSNLFHQLFWGY
jgi:hypothetical protein